LKTFLNVFIHFVASVLHLYAADTLPTSDQVTTSDNLSNITSAGVDLHVPDSGVDGHETEQDQAVALTAAAEAVVRQSTAAVAPLIFASSTGSGVDEQHESTAM